MNDAQASHAISAIATLAISNLSCESLIQYSLGNIGCALFPESSQLIFSNNFVEATWDNSSVQNYWRETHGQGYLLFLHDDLYIELQELARQMRCGESDELNKLLLDDNWVKKTGQKIKGDMMRYLPKSIDGVVDFWIHHEELN
ncbi:hypothetical protein [Sapientia aquatica]|uniref:Uncharacterized protein n=1 Tax=Sapientia aquatica TaxID=1549640 RepID=A0A4R5W4B4_9BURK|nr:hypothetical protein [Sapientia aquatica]TDK66409.1 hypothetical protein E2I14_08005 [Sapientia aquatica]